MNENIKCYLQQQFCATICCLEENGDPYCFNCFFEFDQQNGLLYFKSANEAYHSKLIERNPIIAGTILPDKINKFIVKGVQFRGEVVIDNHPLAKDAKSMYYKKFPAALAMKGVVYTIIITHIKMTDSSNIFGKKTSWDRIADAGIS